MGRWSRLYDACKLCNTTRHSHHGHGLCQVCHPRVWRGQNPEKVSVQKENSYVRNYVLRNDEVRARRKVRYRENEKHRENAKENARRQYRKNPELYKQRAEARRKRIDRAAFERIKPFVLERDGYRCQTPECGITERLHVHHINLDGADHRMENLITLCDFHHKAIPEHHEHKRKY